MLARLVAIALVIGSVACSRGRSGIDGGTVPGTDTGPRPDTGMTTGDPCLAGTGTDTLRTLGCNGGFASGDAPAGSVPRP